MESFSTPAALFVAHPGHELRVHGWLEKARPFACVLTDGSGAHGRPRLASTLGVLDQAGAQPGPIFGRLTDRAAYEALLACDAGVFIDLARELAAFLVRNRIATIVGDAREGYNPVHDVARAVIDTAVRVATTEGHTVRNLDFLVVGLPGDGAGVDGARVCPVELDAAALQRKLEAARGFQELEAEVKSCLDRFGPAAFQVEHLREVTAASEPSPAPPFYESFGATRVAEGRYASVLRYADHVMPLVRALERHTRA